MDNTNNNRKDSLNNEKTSNIVSDEDLSAVSGGLNGAYADVLFDPNEELENAAKKGGCGNAR